MEQSSVAPSSPKVDKKEVSRMGSDIIGLHSPERLTQDQSSKLSPYAKILIVVVSGLALIFASFAGAQSRGNQEARDRKRRYRQALSRFKKGVADLSQDSADSKKKVAQFQVLLSQFIADRTMTTTSSMTDKELLDLLGKKNIPSELQDEMQDLLRKSNQARFGGKDIITAQDLFKKSEDIAVRLEKAL